jgi:integrase
LAAGTHPKIVAERLGHSTIAVTLDTYSHVIPSLEEETATRLAQLILGIADGTP